MNILFVDQYADLGGAQLCLLDIVEAVRSRGWRAHAALPGDGPLRTRLRRLGVPVTDIPCGPFSSGRKTAGDVLRFGRQFPVLTRRIRTLIEAHDAPVVYVNGPRALYASCAAARGRASVLFHCHSLLEPAAARLCGWSLRLPARASVVAASHFVAQPLMQHVAPARLRVIYNGVADCAVAAPVRADGFQRVGVIGRIASGKGQLEFVRAARILAGELTGVRFVICGAPLFSDREAERYFDTIRREAAGWPLEFWGWREDVKEALSQLDVLVVPSVGTECTPRVIPEAYSAGVPVVAFRSGGIPEIVEHEVTGYLASAPTAEALASVLRDVLGKRCGSVRDTATRAREAWRERFNVSRFQRQILEGIEQLE